jgi:two-component system response regulator NreC
MNSAEQLRIVIVDEQALVRAGLRALLEAGSEMIVVAEAADATEGVAFVRQTQAQVLLVGRPAGGEDGAGIAQLVSQAMVHTNLLVLTPLQVPTALESLLMAGVRGYLTRSAGAAELLEGVRTVARGALFRCPTIAPAWGRAGAVDPADVDRQRFGRLTEREQAVLVCTAQGFSAPQIGARLHISAKTVDTYKHRIHEKLGLHDRSEYVRLAMKLRLLEHE